MRVGIGFMVVLGIFIMALLLASGLVHAQQQTIQASNTTHALFYNGTAAEISHTVANNIGTLRTTGIANVNACDDSRNRVVGSASADSIWRVNYSVGKAANTGTINWIWVYGEIRDIDTSYADYYHLEERNATEAAWVDLNVTTTRLNTDVPYRFNITGVNVSRFVSGTGANRWLNLLMRGWGGSADTLELDCLYVVIDYTPPPGDTQAPTWGNNITNNDAIYTYGNLSQFNITWTDASALSVVYIQHNFTGSLKNDTMASLGGGNYGYSMSLGAGSWRWRSYANDTSNNKNWSDEWTFTVDKATPAVSLSSSNGWTYTYGPSTTLTGSEANNGDSDLTYTLYRNGTAISNPMAQVFASANYNITYNTTGGANYTLGGTSNLLSVLKATLSLSIEADSGDLWTRTYPNQTTITGSETNSGDSDITYTLYQNNSVVSNPRTTTHGAGNYYYAFNSTNSGPFENYSAGQISGTLIIQQNQSNPVNMSLNNGTTYWNQNITVTEGTQTIATGYVVTANAGVALLWRNATSVANPDTQTLAAGNWSYKVNTSGNINYTANNTGLTFYIIVNPAPGGGDEIPPTIALNSPADNFITNFSLITFNVTISDNVNATNASLYHNTTGSWQLNSTNTSCNPSTGASIECTFRVTFADGYVGWRIEGSDNSSNKANSSIRAFILDTTAPIVVIDYPVDNTHYNSSNFTYYINGTSSDDRLDKAWTNHTSWAGLDSAPSIFNFSNTSALPDGWHSIKISANDTAGNTGASTITFFYNATTPSPSPDITPPLILFVDPTPANKTTLAWSTTSVTINVSVTEANCGIIVLNWDGSNNTFICETPYWQKTVAVIVGNEYSFYTWVNDTANNANQTEQRSFSIQPVPSTTGIGGSSGSGTTVTIVEPPPPPPPLTTISPEVNKISKTVLNITTPRRSEPVIAIEVTEEGKKILREPMLSVSATPGEVVSFNLQELLGFVIAIRLISHIFD